MSISKKLACVQGIKSNAPNQKLAKKLASSNRSDAIREIAQNLWNRDKAIQITASKF